MTRMMALRRPNETWFRVIGCMCCMGAVTLAGFCLGLRAEAADTRKANTSREARDESVAAIPLERFAQPDREQVAYVLKNASIYRRLPTQVIDCDPNLYTHLLRNPDVLVQIWQTLGISACKLERIDENTYRAEDGEGTRATLRMVHTSHDKHVIYAEGTYSGPMFPQPINAKCVVMMRSGCMKETNGRYYVTARLDTFLRIDRIGVELIAKTLQPLMGRAADHNFAETMAFTASLSRTAEVNPQGVERLAMKLNRIDPETRDEFVQILKNLGDRANQPAREAEARKVGYQGYQRAVGEKER